MRSFNELMTQWERVFISKGTYLLMEKCLMLVYRNLVKKMSVGSWDHVGQRVHACLADVLNKTHHSLREKDPTSTSNV